MMLGRLRWRKLWSDMIANSTLVTHGSFRSQSFFLLLNLPMWEIWSDVP
jgi:hypothetical protein